MVSVLDPIGEAVAVGVRVERVGRIGAVDLDPVEDAVVVGVGVTRIGAVHAQLIEVVEPVPVGVLAIGDRLHLQRRARRGRDDREGVEERVVALAASGEVAPGAAVGVGYEGVAVGAGIHASHRGTGTSRRVRWRRHVAFVGLHLVVVPEHADRCAHPGRRAAHSVDAHPEKRGLDILPEEMKLADIDLHATVVAPRQDRHAVAVGTIPRDRIAPVAGRTDEQQIARIGHVIGAVAVQVAHDLIGRTDARRLEHELPGAATGPDEATGVAGHPLEREP